jgi:hypothetical protein
MEHFLDLLVRAADGRDGALVKICGESRRPREKLKNLPDAREIQGARGDEDDKVVCIDRGPELDHIAWQRVKLTPPVRLNEKGVEHFHDDDE